MYRKGTWVNAKAMRTQGMSYNEIANALGINKRTAIKLCKRDGIPTPAPRDRPSILDPFTEIVDAWLEKRPRMNATVIFSQLQPLGYAGSYPTVKRYVASKKEELSHRATVRFETLPGFQAQVDFGKLRVEFLSGEVRRVTFFVLQMGFSRYRIAYVCPDETRDTLIACLSSAFAEIGGLPMELLLDNMKPVVTTPKTSDEPAVLSDEWMRFCGYYGITTNPCWPYRAQTKGKVERLIGMAKGFMSSRTFLDAEHLEAEFAADTVRYNSSIHSTTKQEPILRLELERSYLAALPERPYSYTLTHNRTASRDLMVSFEGSKYCGALRLRLQEGESEGHARRGPHLLEARCASSEPCQAPEGIWRYGHGPRPLRGPPRSGSRFHPPGEAAETGPVSLHRRAPATLRLRGGHPWRSLSACRPLAWRRPRLLWRSS